MTIKHVEHICIFVAMHILYLRVLLCMFCVVCALARICFRTGTLRSHSRHKHTLFPANTHIHTHTRAHTHVCTHTCTHTRAHTHANKHTCAHTRKQTHMRTHTHTHSHKFMATTYLTVGKAGANGLVHENHVMVLQRKGHTEINMLWRCTEKGTRKSLCYGAGQKRAHAKHYAMVLQGDGTSKRVMGVMQ